VGETRSCKQWLEKRTARCTSGLYWGPHALPAPVLCRGCGVSPQSEPPTPLLQVRTSIPSFSPPPTPGFTSSSHTMQLGNEHPTVQTFSSSIPNPRPQGHPSEHPSPPVSQCHPFGPRLPASAELVLQHIPSSETAGDIPGGVIRPTVGSRLFAQTRLCPLTVPGVHRCLPMSYLYFIQPDKASPLVLEHHLTRFNSCCIPSQRYLPRCTLGPVQDLLKPVENSH